MPVSFPVRIRSSTREFAADDDAHPVAGHVLAAQVEQVRDLDDVGVLAQLPVAVVRALPGVRGHEPDGVPDRVGDGVADRELEPLNRNGADQGVGVAGAISPDQDLLAAPPVRDLRQRPVQHGEVVGGGVAAGVAGAQHHHQGLVAVVQPGSERVMTEAALEVPASFFLVECESNCRSGTSQTEVAARG